MTRRPHISSAANDRLKALRRLARGRGSDGFLLEGHPQLRRALDGRAELTELYVAPELYLGERDPVLVARAEARGARVTVLGAEAFRSVSRATRPDGLLAVAKRWPTQLSALTPGDRPLLLVAEATERPGNLGTIVRSACAAGATGVLACDCSTDVFHPEVVRGSVGALFHVPVASASSRDAVAWLGEHGIPIVVAAPGVERPCWAAALTGPVAVVVGSERHGVSRTWVDAADELVSIPMPGPADSLNVAVAAGIVLFEAVRQRSGAPVVDAR